MGNTWHIKWFPTLESTNSEALDHISAYDNLSVVAAREQTAGRGQRGNRWLSQAGENLTFSLVLKPSGLVAADQMQLTALAAVAVRSYLLSEGIPARIKWPNDIYVGDRKICGMLIENSLEGPRIRHSVIGIGLNVNQRTFPPGLLNPTSMALCTRKTYSPEEELPRLLSFFRVDELGSPTLWEVYTAELYRLGELHTWSLPDDSTLQGTLRNVLPDGRLLLQTPEGERLFAFKEIGYII